MDESDWDGLQTPLQLNYNFQVVGGAGSSGSNGLATAGTILDFAFISNKVQLADGVTLEISRLVVMRYRIGNHNQAPGLDLLVPSAPGTMSVLRIADCVVVHRACYPVAIQMQSMGIFPRPALIPGNQSGDAMPPQPASCTNSTAARPLEQCWAHRGLYGDFAVAGAETDKYGKVNPSNIIVHLLRDIYLCEIMMTDECIKQKGALGCAFYTFANLNPAAPGLASSNSTTAPSPGPGPAAGPATAGASLPDASPGGDDDGGGGGGGSDTLAIALGASLGGAALLCVVIGVSAAVIKWRRRLRREESLEGTLASSAPVIMNEGYTYPVGEGGSSTSKQPSHVCTLRAHSCCFAVDGPAGSVPVAAAGSTDTSAIPSADHAGDAGEGVGDVLKGTAQQFAAQLACAGCSTNGVLVAGSVSHNAVISPTNGDCHTTSNTQYPLEVDRPAGLQPLDPLVVVTPLTPHRTDVNLRLQAPDGEGTAAAAASANSLAMRSAPLSAPAGSSIQGDNEVKLLPITLGKGSFGRVVEGTYQGGRVAVKLMADVLGAAVSSEGLVSSFAQEVEVLARCHHPHVVRLLAACMQPPRLCLVMELMDTSLEAMIRRAPDYLLPMHAVLGIALDVARGLEYLHPTIVHRDLKPANVLVNDPLGPGQVAKLSDFGLARLRSSVLVTINPEAGTPPYMAPECFDATIHSLSHHMDMYSLGTMLWAMLAGCEPWRGVNMVRLAYLVTHAHVRPPLCLIPYGRRHPKLLRLIQSCWEADPRRRPAAAEAAKELMLVRESMQLQERQQQASTGPERTGDGDLYPTQDDGNKLWSKMAVTNNAHRQAVTVEGRRRDEPHNGRVGQPTADRVLQPGPGVVAAATCDEWTSGGGGIEEPNCWARAAAGLPMTGSLRPTAAVAAAGKRMRGLYRSSSADLLSASQRGGDCFGRSDSERGGTLLALTLAPATNPGSTNDM